MAVEVAEAYQKQQKSNYIEDVGALQGLLSTGVTAAGGNRITASPILPKRLSQEVLKDKNIFASMPGLTHPAGGKAGSEGFAVPLVFSGLGSGRAFSTLCFFLFKELTCSLACATGPGHFDD